MTAKLIKIHNEPTCQNLSTKYGVQFLTTRLSRGNERSD
jgi:hypothetical protein